MYYKTYLYYSCRPLGLGGLQGYVCFDRLIHMAIWSSRNAVTIMTVVTLDIVVVRWLIEHYRDNPLDWATIAITSQGVDAHGNHTKATRTLALARNGCKKVRLSAKANAATVEAHVAR